jgi:hypothetical protein
MYQIHTPTDISFVPDAKIVLANRAMETNATDFGKAYLASAEEISNSLRSGYLNGIYHDKAKNQIASVISAVKETAAETDSEELIEFLETLAKILNITLTKTYKVSITFSVDAEIELPLGSDESDVDADDFSLYLEYNNYDCDLSDWEVTDRTIDYIEASN